MEQLVIIVVHSAPCEQCQQMGEQCVPRNGVWGALACERCSCRKAGCSHVGPSASAAPSTNVAGWHAAVHDGAALVADAMDRQTEVLGEPASEVHGLRRIVERLSSSSASSLRGAASGGDTGRESAWDEDEEMKEDEEMWMGDERVELQVCGEGEESSDAEEEEESSDAEEEEEDEGGRHDEERERDGDDEEEDGDEEGVDDEGGAEPEASTTPWQPRVPRPRMKAWKGKGKATKKGKGKGVLGG